MIVVNLGLSSNAESNLEVIYCICLQASNVIEAAKKHRIKADYLMHSAIEKDSRSQRPIADLKEFHTYEGLHFLRSITNAWR